MFISRETLNQSTLTVASLLSRPLSLLGWQLKPLVEAASKKVFISIAFYMFTMYVCVLTSLGAAGGGLD